MPCSRAAVRSCVDPGNAGEIHFSRPAGSAMTCALTPGRGVAVAQVGQHQQRLVQDRQLHRSPRGG